MCLGGIDQWTTTYLAFGKCLKRTGSAITRYVLKKESLCGILIKFGVPQKLFTLVKAYLDGTQEVRIGSYSSSNFPIEICFNQGDVLLLQL